MAALRPAPVRSILRKTDIRQRKDGRPLAGRSQEQNQTVANRCDDTKQQRTPPCFLQNLIAPVFSLCWLRNRIAPDIHRDQACRVALRPPWWHVPPQRNVGAKPCPRGCLHSLWLSPWRRQSLSGSRLGRFGNLHSIRWRKGDVQSLKVVVHQSAFLAHRLWPNRYPKHRLTSKGFCSRSM